MTADAFPEDMQKCVAAGMNAHISKPVDPEKLFGILKNYIKPSEDRSKIR
jgi:two-component system sensor histidine kinase/response regulator